MAYSFVRHFLTKRSFRYGRRGESQAGQLTLFEEDRRKIEGLGRPAASVLRVHQHMQPKPIVSIPITAEQLSVSAPTVAKAIQHMKKFGMVRETTGKQRHRLFGYWRYVDILNEGGEPIEIVVRH